MSLFSTTELTRKKDERAVSGSVLTAGTTLLTIGKANAKLHQVFGQVAPDQSVHYVSLGDWSTHDLLFFLLEQTGPARVYFTTWAISEYAIRQLYQFIEHGLILELKGIFDYRNGIRKPAELQFLQKITTDIKAAKCHAKVTVIENDHWGISVVGSANYTRNPRIEAGVLCCDRKVTAFHRDWILHELSNTSVFNGNE
ncbi:MAG: hypothetical protein EOM90_04795 [Alphaproteobacteria bacterium]|nr:hypothetical protein [Alphaproteobacteria bacterium]